MAKKPRINAILGPFTFSHPYLTAPDTEGTYADNKYKVDAITAPKSATAVQTEEAVKDALKKLGLPAKGTQLPFKKETEKDENGKRKPTGNLLFRTKSKFAPAIVDAKGAPIPAAALKNMKIGAGTEGRIEGYFQAYEMKVQERVDGELVTSVVPGLSFTLTGVQVLNLIQGGGRGSTGFGAFDGGYSYEGGPDDEVSDDSGLSLSDDGDDASDDDDAGALDI